MRRGCIMRADENPSVWLSDAKALNVLKDVTKDVTIEIKILNLIKENASITTTVWPGSYLLIDEQFREVWRY